MLKMWIVEEGPRKRGYYQFGMQRTGTTAIDAAIRHNYQIWKMNDHPRNLDREVTPPHPNLCWKHNINIPPKMEDDAPVILNYKNPYTLIESFAYRKGLGNGGWDHTYKDLYKQPYNPEICIDRKGDGRTYIKQVMMVYKHWAGTWLRFANREADRTTLIKYENLLVPEKRIEIFDGISQKYGWGDPIPGDLFWPEHCGSSLPIADRIEYYLNEEPTKLTRVQIDCINDTLGTDLIERMGYRVI
jgi:hypothetical protein